MEFDGHQSTFTNSLFPAYYCQSSVSAGVHSNGNVAVPHVSIPDVSLQEQHMASDTNWSHNAHDDPYQLINCAQNSSKFSDTADRDGETDLQRIVSNILDDGDAQDGFYSEGNVTTCNSIWSPKTLHEELLHYVQSEHKTPTCVSHEAFNKAQGQAFGNEVKDFCQQPNSFVSNQHLSLSSGNRDSYTASPQKLPPGLPVPNMASTYMPCIPQCNYDSVSVNKDRGTRQPMNNLLDLGDVLRPQSEMNSPRIDQYYEGHSAPGNAKPMSNEEYIPQNFNQFVSSFQSLMAGNEEDTVSHGDYINMHMQQHEDNMTWKNTSAVTPARCTSATQIQKQLMADYESMQKERNGGVRKHMFNPDGLQDLPRFSPQNTEYFQPPKPLTGPLYCPKQYQNKMAMHRENASLPVNMKMNQHLKHHIHQGQIQNEIKLQMQKEKKRMGGSLAESFSVRPLNDSDMVQEEQKQAVLQNPYFDLRGSLQPQRFEGGSSLPSAGNMPFMCPVNDPRRHSSLSIPSLSDMTCRGETTYHGRPSVMTSSMTMKQGGPVIKLYLCLDECYEQWRSLEKERKRTQSILSKAFHWKRTAAVTNTNLLKTPPNPTRVDHLIVTQMREQAKVASLLDKMKCLCSVPLHINIHMALIEHHMAISVAHARRKEETANMSQNQQQHFSKDRDTMRMVVALKDLADSTSKLRTALFCALQMTLPKPVKRQEQNVTVTESYSCPWESSFKLWC